MICFDWQDELRDYESRHVDLADVCWGTIDTLLPDMLRLLRKDGTLILSGIRVDQQSAVCKRLEELNLSPPEITQAKDWICCQVARIRR